MKTKQEKILKQLLKNHRERMRLESIAFLKRKNQFVHCSNNGRIDSISVSIRSVSFDNGNEIMRVKSHISNKCVVNGKPWSYNYAWTKNVHE